MTGNIYGLDESDTEQQTFNDTDIVESYVPIMDTIMDTTLEDSVLI